MTHYSLRVREVIEETPDAKSIVFDVPREHAQVFRYKPGQFLTLRIAHDGRHLLRCYSLASCPLIDEPPRVTVKRVALGRVWVRFLAVSVHALAYFVLLFDNL